MLWISLSLAAAFLMASNSAFMKYYFSDLSPWEMATIPFFYSAPLCIISLLFIDVPPLGPDFFSTIAWVLPLTMFAMVLHFRAIFISPLSLTIPFLSFTPVFAIVSGDILLGEELSRAGVFGILLVVVGGYVINLDSARYGVWGPIKAIHQEKGSTIMLIVAGLYGLSSVGGKIVLLQSSPMFGAMTLFGLYGPILTFVLVGIGKTSIRKITRKPFLGLFVGICVYIEVICHNLAITMVAAAYMITIKRMAGLFSVLYGWFLFNEQGIQYRLIGTLTMTFGVVCIVLYG